MPKLKSLKLLMLIAALASLSSVAWSQGHTTAALDVDQTFTGHNTFTQSITLPFTGSIRCLHVNSAGVVGVTSVDCGIGGGGLWGSITGTLSNQTDLQTALNAKTNVAIVPNTAPTAGQLLIGNAGGAAYAPISLSGDCTLASTGVITCLSSSPALNAVLNPTGNKSFDLGVHTLAFLNGGLGITVNADGSTSFTAPITLVGSGSGSASVGVAGAAGAPSMILMPTVDPAANGILIAAAPSAGTVQTSWGLTLDTDGSFASPSNITVPSVAAVVTYVLSHTGATTSLSSLTNPTAAQTFDMANWPLTFSFSSNYGATAGVSISSTAGAAGATGYLLRSISGHSDNPPFQFCAVGSKCLRMDGAGAITVSGGAAWPTFNQDTTGSAAKWTTARTIAGNSVDGSANVVFANKLIVQGTVDAGLSDSQFLGSLGTGIVKNTNITGVLSLAAAADVVGLFNGGTCSGYLKFDSTCDNPAGAGTVTHTGDLNATANAVPTGSGAADLTASACTIAAGVETCTGFSGPLTGNVTGNLTGNVTGNVSGTSGSTTGNAATATVLATTRAINGVNFNGSAAITVPVNNADDTTTNASMFPLWTATVGGNFAAKVSSTKLTFNPSSGTLTTTTFSGALSGTATNATNTAITDDTSTAATMYPAWVTATTGNLPQKISSTKLSFVPSTGIFTATGFAGALTGNVTGNVSGTAATFTGSLSGDVTSSAMVTTVVKVNGVAYGTSPSTNTVPIITASNTATYTAITNCGDSTHALAYDTTTHLFSCQAITASATAGGSDTQIQYNNATALGGAANLLYNSTTGQFTASQLADTNETIYGKRATDTTPTGDFLRFQNAAANADMFKVSVLGTTTAVGFAGPLVGNVTGNVTGNADTATSAAKWTTARALAGNSVDGSVSVAFANKFIVQGTVDAGLSGPQFLGALGTGILKNTTSTGVLSIAVAGDFPTLNQNTTGTAAGWTTARNLAGNSVNGTVNVVFVNKFIVQGTADSGLSGAQFLGSLSTGILKNTTATGVLSAAASADVIALFTSCSGIQYLGADGACHAAGTGTGDVVGPASATDKHLAIFNSTTGKLIQQDTGCSTDGAGALTCSIIGGSGTNGGLDATEGTGASLTAAAGHDLLYADSTLHRWLVNNNNGGPFPMSYTVASGSTAMGTSSIAANTCATVVTVAATSVATTDTITFTPNGSIKAVTGYTPAGTLSIVAYPTAGNVNFDVCNKDQTNAVTPGAVTLNWKVLR